ncbi:hypothetical protein ABFS83_12G087900 [Erythranthe nasuta]
MASLKLVFMATFFLIVIFGSSLMLTGAVMVGCRVQSDCKDVITFPGCPTRRCISGYCFCHTDSKPGAPMLSEASSTLGYFGRCYKDSDCNISSPLRRDCKKRVCMNTYCFCGGGNMK